MAPTAAHQSFSVDGLRKFTQGVGFKVRVANKNQFEPPVRGASEKHHFEPPVNVADGTQ